MKMKDSEVGGGHPGSSQKLKPSQVLMSGELERQLREKDWLPWLEMVGRVQPRPHLHLSSVRPVSEVWLTEL